MTLTRRTLLQAAGVSVALPWLEAFASSDSASPVRTLTLVTPNGVSEAHFFPVFKGPLNRLPYSLEPLTPYASELTVISGLDGLPYTELHHGYDPHANTMAALLTGAVPGAQHLEDLVLSPSFDQILGHATRPRHGIPALVISSSPYWRTLGVPNKFAWSHAASFGLDGREARATLSPQAALRVLFGDTSVDPSIRAARARRRESALDLILDQVDTLQAKLGYDDRQRLDRYLTSLREVEKDVLSPPNGDTCPTDVAPPAMLPVVSMSSAEAHIRQMAQISALAMVCDRTRVITHILGNGGNERHFPEFGGEGSHHDLSHHFHRPETLLVLRDIDRWYASRFADILEELSSWDLGGHTLLDTCQVLYVNEQRDGNLHDATNLPIILAGRAGGRLTPRGHLALPSPRPVTDLFLRLMANAGHPIDAFGAHSTGPLDI